MKRLTATSSLGWKILFDDFLWYLLGLPILLCSIINYYSTMIDYKTTSQHSRLGYEVCQGISLKALNSSQRLNEILEKSVVYAHPWKEGDIIFWDNSQVMHCGQPYDSMNQQRIGLRLGVVVREETALRHS